MGKIKSSGIGEQIIELWDEGYSGDKIAKMTGDVVAGRSILRFLNRSGINTSETIRLVKCHNCGKEFEKKRYLYLKSRLHFCSMPCYWEHLKNPDYIRSVYGSRMARKAIRACGYVFSPEEVVHHRDGDANNNNSDNLMVFKNQGDHNRWHRDGNAKPVWPDEFILTESEKERLSSIKSREKVIKYSKKLSDEAEVFCEENGVEPLKGRQVPKKVIKTVSDIPEKFTIFKPQPKVKWGKKK